MLVRVIYPLLVITDEHFYVKCLRVHLSASDLLDLFRLKIYEKHWNILISFFLIAFRSRSSVKRSPWTTRVYPIVNRTTVVSSPRQQGANPSTSHLTWPVSCSWKRGSARPPPSGKSPRFPLATWNTETRTIVLLTWTVWRLTYSNPSRIQD